MYVFKVMFVGLVVISSGLVHADEKAASKFIDEAHNLYQSNSATFHAWDIAPPPL